MKATSLLLVLSLHAALWAPLAWAIDVEATGTAAIFSGNVASARGQALVNAQRNAVEQGVGVLLDSKTTATNFQIIKDEILTASKGFVTKYSVVSEGRSPDNGSYTVKIKATVSRELLRDRLSALRILHKKMGNKRVMVIYHSTNPNAMARNHGATTAALQVLQDTLNKSGFRVFNEAASQKVYATIENPNQGTRPVADLIAMALDQQADILVRFENIGGKKGPVGGMFSAAFSTIRVSVFDTATGRQIADSQSEAKQLMQAKAGPYDWESGLAKASAQAAANAGKEAIGKIANFYEQTGDQGTAFLIVFKNFSDDEKDAILDFLENTPGFRQMSELKNSPKYLELELFSGDNVSRLRRQIRAGLKEKGILLQIQSSHRNRIVFSNQKGG